LLACLLPHGNDAGADSQNAPPYLASVRKFGYHLRVEILGVEALVAQEVAVWQLPIFGRRGY